MDERTYIRLHDGMPDHPKVVGLSDRAFRLYVEALCWCSRHLTDGNVPAAALRRLGGYSAGSVRELTSVRLLEPGATSDWQVHDYTEHQRTAEAVAEYRQARKAGAVAGNHERWHVARGLIDPSCPMCVIADASLERSPNDHSAESGGTSLSDPDRSQETETEKEKKKDLARIGSDDDPDFTTFWAAYPRRIGKGQARKAWRSAVIGRRTEPKDLIRAAEQFAAEVRRKRTEPDFIPYPATWLNGERHLDVEATPQRERNYDF